MKRASALVALTALALLGCALLARLSLLVIFLPFDGLYGQDAFAYYEYARSFARAVAELRAPAPFAWSLGYPALLASAFALAGASALTAQGVTLLAGAFVAPLVYLWVRDLSFFAGEQGQTPPLSGLGAGALLAGLVAALGGQLAQSSLVVMSDAPALCWAALGALAFTRYARTRRGSWIGAASLAFTFALLTRWIYAAPALICVFAFLLLQRGVPFAHWRHHAVLALVLPFPFLLAQLLTPSDFPWVGDWHPANALARVFENADGHFAYNYPPAVFYAAPLLHNLYVSPLLLPFVLFGAWRMRRAPTALQVLLFAWIAMVYLFLAGIPYENIRFGLALWLPVAALAGIGFNAAWQANRDGVVATSVARPTKVTSPATKVATTDHGDKVVVTSVAGSIASPASARIRALRPVWRAALVVVAAVALFGMAGGGRDALAPIVRLQRDHFAVVRSTAAAVPASSTVITLGMGGYFRQLAPDLHTLELYNQTPQTLERFSCALTPTFLLIEPESIAGQWAGSSPGQNVRFLRERIGLAEAARLGAFTLYRVGGACA